jgi:hypothetical protein
LRISRRTISCRVFNACFVEKQNTLGFYRNGAKNLLAFAALGQAKLDAMTSDKITALHRESNDRRDCKWPQSIVSFKFCGRMFRLAVDWDKLEKVPPKVELRSGQPRRNRVLTSDEEREYFRAAQMIGEDIEDGCRRA